MNKYTIKICKHSSLLTNKTRKIQIELHLDCMDWSLFCAIL